MIFWRCPRCRGQLRSVATALVCDSCGIQYEVVAGIPDLRLPGDTWVDYEADRSAARRLADRAASGAGVQELLRDVFGRRPDWSEDWIELRIRQALRAPERMAKESREWLRPYLPSTDRFLDLGCGSGALLIAAEKQGYEGLGIDVCMEWLVVARQALLEAGCRPLLAAALAESLPLPDASVAGVVSLDVIEHVADPLPYLREIDRVTAKGGTLAFSTPNRFSLAPEPHVGLLGVGWLPRRLQSRYVGWRSGKAYDFVRLLSAWEAERLVHRHTDFRVEVRVPAVPQEELQEFRGPRRWLGTIYSRLVRISWLRWVFMAVGPFFRVVGTKGNPARSSSRAKIASGRRRYE